MISAGVLCMLVMQVQFRVAVPAGVNQPLNISAMLLHDKFIGFDQKASMTLPALGQQHMRQTPGDHRSNSWQYAAGSSMADDTMGAEEAGDADTAALEDTQQHSFEAVGAVPAQGDALLGYEALKHKQQMRNKRARQAAVDVQYGSGAGHSADVAAAGADDAAADHNYDGMPPPAKRTARSSRPGDTGPRQEFAAVQQQAADTHEGMEHAGLGRQVGHGPSMLNQSAAHKALCSSGDQPGPPPQQSLIAARYRSMFSLSAAGGLGSAQQASASSCSTAAAHGSFDGACRGDAGMGMPSSTAGPPMAQAVTGSGPTVAVDAGELQVTPSGPGKTPRPLPPGSTHATADDAVHTHSPQQSHASQLLQQERQLQVLDASAAAAGSEPPVPQVGQAMSSLFDMLADDEDADQQDLAQEQEQHSSVQQQQYAAAQVRSRHLPVSSSAASASDAFDNLGNMRTDPGTRNTNSLQQLQQQQQSRSLLAERQVMHPGRGDTRESLPASASSSSTVFGAVVHRSHQATRSLMSSLQSHSRQLHSVGFGVSSEAAREQTAAVAVAGKPGLLDNPQAQHTQQQMMPAEGGSSMTTQPLLTPPHQIRPVFTKSIAAGAAASNTGSAASSRVALQSRREVAARWSAGNAAGAGSYRAGSQQPRAKELPDFSRFAFSTGVLTKSVCCMWACV
jgi:hypothetical protein